MSARHILSYYVEQAMEQAVCDKLENGTSLSGDCVRWDSTARTPEPGILS